MSGGIFQPTVESLDIEEFRRNPLLCYLCNEQYDDPCLLSCYHSFCAQCLRGRATDGKTVCPLCSEVTEVSDKVPPTDPLLKFLVESSTEEQVLCANCDQAENGMFFCNTCNQPLCEGCRDDTHAAKMFQKHEIVKMSKRTKDIHKKCTLHGEPYIMFCKQKKTMLCINCFRDTSVEMRSHCIDLDSAYNQGCKKLDQAVQQIRQLQNSVHDAIVLLRSLLEELMKNSDSEKEAINGLYVNMQERILQKKDHLLDEVDREYQDRQQVFKEQLTTLNSLLPTLHINLVTCTAFSSSANKYEFLDLAYVLIGRLQNITNLPHPIHPSQGSSFHTDFKLEFARCLETLVPFRSLSYPKDSSYAAKSLGSNHSNSGKRLEGSPVPSMPHYGYVNGFRRNGTSKVMFVEARGAFAEHCKEVDSKYKEIMQRFDKLKTRVQELQRDLTLRRCLTKKDNVDSIVEECQGFGTELTGHLETLEQKRPLLEKHWEETCQMIADEQEIYQAQLNDTVRLRQENEHVIVIAKQLQPFIKTITDVTQRLAPKLSASKKSSEKEDVLSAILEQINTMQPDSQQRVVAIQAAQEDRETLNANKTNPMDDALIKTKGMLKAAHRDSDGNRLSGQWVDPKCDSVQFGRVLDDDDLADKAKNSLSSGNICDNNLKSASDKPIDNQIVEDDVIVDEKLKKCGIDFTTDDSEKNIQKTHSDSLSSPEASEILLKGDKSLNGETTEDSQVNTQACEHYANSVCAPETKEQTINGEKKDKRDTSMEDECGVSNTQRIESKAGSVSAPSAANISVNGEVPHNGDSVLNGDDSKSNPLKLESKAGSVSASSAAKISVNGEIPHNGDSVLNGDDYKANPLMLESKAGSVSASSAAKISVNGEIPHNGDSVLNGDDYKSNPLKLESKAGSVSASGAAKISVNGEIPHNGDSVLTGEDDKANLLKLESNSDSTSSIRVKEILLTGDIDNSDANSSSSPSFESESDSASLSEELNEE